MSRETSDTKITETALDDAFGSEFDESAAAALDEGDRDDGGAGDEGIDDEQLAQGLDGEEGGEGGADGDAGDAGDEVESIPTNDEGAEASGERRRDPATGKFIAADKSKPGTKPVTDGTKAVERGTAAATSETKATAPAPQWQGVEVKAGGESVRIDEARVTKANGHHFFAVPDAQAARFMQRLSRGALYDRTNRELAQARREIDARKTATAVPTDEQIEAQLTLETIKPFLPEFLDEKDIKVLEAQVRAAKLEAQGKRVAYESDIAAKVAQEPWEDEQVGLLQDRVLQIIRASADLADLDPVVINEIYETEMLPIVGSLIFKDGDKKYANDKWIYDRLRKAVGVKGATPAASAPTKPSTDAPSSDAKKTTAGERFNRGVSAAPRTTSLKDKRTPRPANAEARRDRATASATREQRTPAMIAEDDFRRARNSWLNTDSLDLPDEG